MYCKQALTDKSPSHYNCGCRTKPSPTAVSVSFVLPHDEYKETGEEIHHLAIHYDAMSEGDLKKH